MAIIGKFLASKWVTVALMLALVGGAYYVYSQGKILGGAKEKLQAYEVTITQQQDAIARLAIESDAKQQALTDQQKRTAMLERNARLQQLAVQEARKNADKVTRECMSLHLADGLCFGPGCKNTSSKDKAQSNVDG